MEKGRYEVLCRGQVDCAAGRYGQWQRWGCSTEADFMALGIGDYRNCIDSVRLSQEEREALLTRLDSTPVSAAARERRSQERVPYRRASRLLVQMHHPGGTEQSFLVSARNLSCGGIAFLHGSFVYDGTTCILALITTDHHLLQVEGRVVRCRHVTRHLHDIGVKFDGSIDLDQFVAAAAPTGVIPASRPVPRLGGKALCLVDRPADQQVIGFYLGQLGMEARVLGDAMVGFELAVRVKFDAILTNMFVPPMSAGDMAGLLRQAGYAGPIIALAGEKDETAGREAIEQGCNHVLVKPYSLEELMDVLLQHLGEPGGKAQAA
jgi:CheY-like chemotaxis protein